MPHLIIEYPQDLISDEAIATCLDCVHQAASDSGLFDITHIRVRALPLRHYRLGGEKQGFIHVQCRIHAGRSDQQKKELTEKVLASLVEQALEVDVITVEVSELHRPSYTKYLA